MTVAQATVLTFEMHRDGYRSERSVSLTEVSRSTARLPAVPGGFGVIRPATAGGTHGGGGGGIVFKKIQAWMSIRRQVVRRR